MEYRSRCVQDTEALGCLLAAHLSPGTVVAFGGDLGAGKTAFTRGLARGLGVEGPVTSPTYTIVNEYPGPVPLFHFDLYRLTDWEDLFDIGWEDYLDRGGVLAVEWSERAGPLLEDPVRVTIRRDPESEDGRYISIEGGGVPEDLSL